MKSVQTTDKKPPVFDTALISKVGVAQDKVYRQPTRTSPVLTAKEMWLQHIPNTDGKFVFHGSSEASPMCDPRDVDVIWKGTVLHLFEDLAALPPNTMSSMIVLARNLIRVFFVVGDAGIMVQIDVLVVVETEGDTLSTEHEDQYNGVGHLKMAYNAAIKKLKGYGNWDMVPIPLPPVVHMFRHITRTVFDVLTEEDRLVENNSRQRTIKACDPKARVIYEFLKLAFGQFRVPSWVWTFVTYLGAPLLSSGARGDTATSTWNRIHIFLVDMLFSGENPEYACANLKEPKYDGMHTEMRRKLYFLQHNFLRHVPGILDTVTESPHAFAKQFLTAQQWTNIHKKSPSLMARIRFLFGDITDPVRDGYRFNPMLPQHTYITFSIGVRTMLFGAHPDQDFYVKFITAGDPESLGQLCASVLRCVMNKDGVVIPNAVRAQCNACIEFLSNGVTKSTRDISQSMYQNMLGLFDSEALKSLTFLPVINFAYNPSEPWIWGPLIVQLENKSLDMQVCRILKSDRPNMKIANDHLIKQKTSKADGRKTRA